MNEPVDGLSPVDFEHLASRGITAEAARLQLALLRDPPGPPVLHRPVTEGDGLRRLSDDQATRLAARYAASEEARRAVRFVPASGAASRMFRTVLPWVDYAGNPVAASKEMSRRAVAGDPSAGDAIRFLGELPRLPLRDELQRHLSTGGQDLERLRLGGDAGAVLHALLSPENLGYAGRPKALVPFHRYPAEDGPQEVRTALEEHLVEAALSARALSDGDEEPVCRLHFTVPPESRPAIEVHLAEARARLEARHGVRFAVVLSVQSPATDTLALDPGTGGAFRGDDGLPVLRPGGHGALLGNLAAAGGETDVLFVKNVDNVQPDRAKGETVLFKHALAGLLLDLRERSRELLERLEAGDDDALAETRAFLADELSFRFPESFDQLPAAGRRTALVDRLDRPLRVAGMVENRGEPGGGPFWVRRPGGTVAGQIVEKAQVSGQPDQQAVFARSTHFNPVDLVCSVRDREGVPYDLDRFLDPRTVFAADKSHGGRPLRALERPGLWNGAMAGWNTAFVEVPASTFTPVKTVFDLLRKEHQP